MKYGVCYDPQVWGEAHSQPFAEFTWKADAIAYAAHLNAAEHIDYVVVEL